MFAIVMYVCCGECYVVSDECDEPTSCLVQPIVVHCCKVMCWCFDFRGELGFLNCDDIIAYFCSYSTWVNQLNILLFLFNMGEPIKYTSVLIQHG